MKYLAMNLEGQYTHNFHPYPAKFPAYAIRGMILKYTERMDNVLDPFCGSGTTLVECRLLSRNATGIDLNPVGTLISETKSAVYSAKDIETIRNVVYDLKANCFTIKDWLSSYNRSEILSNHPNKEYWFKPHVLKELYAIKKSTIDKFDNNKTVHDLLLTAFSRIIVRVSNQESETRYKAIDKPISPGDTLRLYIKTLEGYLETLAKNNYAFNKEVKIKVIEGDAREEIHKLKQKSFDFVITSPPYINSYDYYLYHKHRIFWLDGNPKKVRRQEVGCHHKIDTQSYDEAISEYGESISKVFGGINKVLKDKKYFALLVGDGIVRNRKVSMDDMVADISSKTGFEMTSIESIPLRDVSYSFIKGRNIERKRHHIVVLRKVRNIFLN